MVSETSVVPNITDGDGQPRLRCDLNVLTLANLPTWSRGPKRLDDFDAIRAAGYEGLQHFDPSWGAGTGLRRCGLGRVDAPADAARIAAAHQDAGLDATTLHLGTGLETEAEMDALVAAVMEASAARRYPLFVELHRATITQDMRRTLDLVNRLPDVRFNADPTHWYTGQEMIYGDFTARLDALAPVFARVRFMHGRVGDSCSMQVPVNDETAPNVTDQMQIWSRCFAGFKQSAAPGDVFVFAPELAPASITVGGTVRHLNYARLVPGPNGEQEETDRWEQALILCRLARRVFAEA